MAIGDHWRWFGRVVAERKVREGDPIVVVLERTLADTSRARWSSTRATRTSSACASGCPRSSSSSACSTGPWGWSRRLEPTELERALRLLGEVPDDTILRLISLLDGLPDDDVLGLVEALSRLSPDVRPARDDADVGGRAHAGAVGARVLGPLVPGPGLASPLLPTRWALPWTFTGGDRQLRPGSCVWPARLPARPAQPPVWRVHAQVCEAPPAPVPVWRVQARVGSRSGSLVPTPWAYARVGSRACGYDPPGEWKRKVAGRRLPPCDNPTVTSDRTGSNGRRPRGQPAGRPLTRPLGEPNQP